MSKNEEEPAGPTPDDERRRGAGRRREPRFDWETGDPIKDRRLQRDDPNRQDDSEG